MAKRSSKIVSFFLAVVFVFSLLPGLKVNADASGNCGKNGDNLTWVLYDNGTLTISGTGAMADYDAGDAPWFGIRGNITSIEISDGVTSIGNWSFYNCTNATSVTIPNTVTSIGENAFNFCEKLNNVTLPASVNTIGECAFSSCHSLSIITINGTITTLGDDAFNGAGLTDIPGNLITSTIPDGTFVGCKFTTITIPNTVTSIGANAFTDCRDLTSVTIPNSVTSIGDSAFFYCTNLTDVTMTQILYDSIDPSMVFPDINPTINRLPSGYCGDPNDNDGKNVIWAYDDSTKTLTISGTGDMEDFHFFEDSSIGSSRLNYPWYEQKNSIKNVVIEEGVTSIGEYSFSSLKKLNSVTISNSVTEIGGSAFSSCSELSSVDLPDNLVSIGRYAFSRCFSLESIEFPDTLTTIDFCAFQDAGLTSITIPGSVTTIGKNAFEKCVGLKTVKLNEGIEIINDSAFIGCEELTNISIPVSVETIGVGAFAYCTGLTSFEADAVLLQKMDFDSVFYGCEQNSITLTAYTFPITYNTCSHGTVSGRAGCPSTDSVEVTVEPDTGYVALEVTVTNSKGTTKINPNDEGKYIFTMPSEDVTVNATFIKGGICGANGDNVTWTLDDEGTLTISGTGDMADYGWNGNYSPFYKNTDIKNVIIGSGITSIGECAFNKCKSLTSINISDSVTSIDNFAFGDCTHLESITIPNSVTSIGDTAFSMCTSLTSITIPDSVTSIGDHAFDSCTSLKSVTIGSGVTSIGDLTFDNCTNLTSITVDHDTWENNQATFSGLPESVVITYTYDVVFVNEDGTVLQSDTVVEFEAPEYTGITPTKAEDVQYTYTFAGWSDGTNTYGPTETLPTVTEDVTYTAVFDSSVKQYTIKFINEDGTVLQSGDVDYGTTPVYTGTTPAKAEDEDYSYSFAGWAPTVTSVTGNATYTATFTETLKPTPAPATPAPTPNPTPVADEEVPAIVSGIAHVQDVGNVTTYMDPETSFLYLGTEGQGKRLESITLNFENPTSYSGTLEYRVHVQDIGWTDWVTAGNPAGTVGQSKRIEAIEIRLTGELADYYSVFYGVHIQDYGDMQGWVQDGALAGTTGESKRIEALTVIIAPKGAVDDISVCYRVHVQDYGWEKSYASNGEMAGTSGESKRLEGIEIYLTSCPYSGGIQYKTHVQDYGWESSWTKSGEMSGTQGQSKRLEGICIELYGEVAEYYDIYYRVHAQDIGWMAWAKNGECAGTAGRSARLEGIQIVLVPKGDPAPSATYEGITAVTDKAFIEGF